MSPIDVYLYQIENTTKKTEKELKREERSIRRLCSKSYKEKGEHSTPFDVR